MDRIPEPEIMDVPERARAYSDADFAEVNEAFVVRLMEEAPTTPGAYVLDLGCGPGDITQRVAAAQTSWRVCGLDASAAMLSMAQSDGDGCFVRGDAKETPFPDGTFHVVISNSILHHVDNTEAFWAEVRRISGPGAFILMRDLLRPESAVDAERIVEAYAKDEHPLLREDFYNSLLAAYTPEEIRGQLRAAKIEGLEVGRVSDRHLDICGRLA